MATKARLGGVAIWAGVGFFAHHGFAFDIQK